MNEVEFKYKATNLPLNVFIELCEKTNPISSFAVSGTDHFYANSTDKNSFYRHRIGKDMNQITFKRKISDKNSYIRKEHDIDLALTTTKSCIEEYCKEFNYRYNFSLFKHSVVYKYEWYLLSYYICYDINMNEVGRFFEIEIEEKMGWNTAQAFKELLILEKLYKPLGASIDTRVKESLFEMYRIKGDLCKAEKN